MILNTNHRGEKVFANAMSATGLIFCIIGFVGTVTTGVGSFTLMPLPILLVGMIFSLIGLSISAAIGSKHKWSAPAIIGFSIGIASFVANLYLVLTAVKVAYITNVFGSIF